MYVTLNVTLISCRATVFLALGRARSGLQDLNKVLQLKSDLTAARMQRASVHFKMGELDLAHIDLEEVVSAAS